MNIEHTEFNVYLTFLISWKINPLCLWLIFLIHLRQVVIIYVLIDSLVCALIVLFQFASTQAAAWPDHPPFRHGARRRGNWSNRRNSFLIKIYTPFSSSRHTHTTVETLWTWKSRVSFVSTLKLLLRQPTLHKKILYFFCWRTRPKRLSV